MTGYIIRRILYAIPIVLGVNLIVFSLFFFVSNPDDMARLHLGAKRVTPDQIDRWKRERSLHLPRFYNAGWQRQASLSARKAENTATFTLPEADGYRLIVDAPDAKKAAQERELEVKFVTDDKLLFEKGSIKLPATTDDREFVFEAKAGDRLQISFKTKEPSVAHRVLLEARKSESFFSRFTQTIFAQRSLKMLGFEFGKSDRGKHIGRQLLDRIGPSLALTVPAFALGLVLNVFFAMILAFFRGTYIDYWGVFLCVIGMSISALFYIIFGQFVIGKLLKLFPISGFEYGLSSIKFIMMPLIISVVAGLGGAIRFYRTIFLEEINKDYVRTARAKGLSETTVLFLHVLKNAMIPILTGLVVSLPLLFTGSLLLESFFAIPGMGAYMLDAIRQQDFAVVQAMVFLGSVLYIVGLIMTDISYTFVDPRVRLE